VIKARRPHLVKTTIQNFATRAGGSGAQVLAGVHITRTTFPFHHVLVAFLVSSVAHPIQISTNGTRTMPLLAGARAQV
jgi:hypothetical protein